MYYTVSYECARYGVPYVVTKKLNWIQRKFFFVFSIYGTWRGEEITRSWFQLNSMKYFFVLYYLNTTENIEAHIIIQILEGGSNHLIQIWQVLKFSYWEFWMNSHFISKFTGKGGIKKVNQYTEISSWKTSQMVFQLLLTLKCRTNPVMLE